MPVQVRPRYQQNEFVLHSRAGLDLQPELHDPWLDWLVQAVKEFDPMFDLETETACRLMLQPGIEFMKSRY